MPCLIAAVVLLAPRLAVALLWYFTHWFGGAWTLWPVVGLVVALAIDLGALRSHRRFTRRS